MLRSRLRHPLHLQAVEAAVVVVAEAAAEEVPADPVPEQPLPVELEPRPVPVVVDEEVEPQLAARVQLAARPQARELRVERLQQAAVFVVDEVVAVAARAAVELQHLLLPRCLS